MCSFSVEKNRVPLCHDPLPYFPRSRKKQLCVNLSTLKNHVNGNVPIPRVRTIYCIIIVSGRSWTNSTPKLTTCCLYIVVIHFAAPFHCYGALSRHLQAAVRHRKTQRTKIKIHWIPKGSGANVRTIRVCGVKTRHSQGQLPAGALAHFAMASSEYSPFTATTSFTE